MLDSVLGHVLQDKIAIVTFEIVCRDHCILVLRCKEPRAEFICDIVSSEMHFCVVLRLQVIDAGNNHIGYVHASLLVALCIKDDKCIARFLGLGSANVALVILNDVPLLAVAAKHLTTAMVFLCSAACLKVLCTLTTLPEQFTYALRLGLTFPVTAGVVGLGQMPIVAGHRSEGDSTYIAWVFCGVLWVPLNTLWSYTFHMWPCSGVRLCVDILPCTCYRSSPCSEDLS